MDPAHNQVLELTQTVRAQVQVGPEDDRAAAHKAGDDDADAGHEKDGLNVELHPRILGRSAQQLLGAGLQVVQKAAEVVETVASDGRNAEDRNDALGKNGGGGVLHVRFVLDENGHFADCVRFEDLANVQHVGIVNVSGSHVLFRHHDDDRYSERNRNAYVFPGHPLQSCVCVHHHDRVIGTQAHQSEDGCFQVLFVAAQIHKLD
mmetsp:Transcript_2985/g.6865  ORF Transcript_2985/g.6865 Transcript_2985/m.6865 type:complete len:205 (-) Transcript_2985:1496-2110(-)